jgi:DNA-binding IclR family transcriptional regulator
VLDRLVLSPLTQRTITEARSLKANIEKIRSVGYAVDDGESTEGVRCVGAAIRSEDRPVAAISVSGPANRLTKGMISQVGLRVVRAAANISGLLGATGTSEPGPAATG